MIHLLALAVIAACVLSWGAVRCLRVLAPRWGLVDVPNHRSSHGRPTPRAGGLGFVFATLVVFATAAFGGGMAVPSRVWLVLGCGLPVALVSLADDRWGLPARVRFGAHLLGSVALVLGGLSLVEVQVRPGLSFAIGWVGVPISILWVVGLTNIYNFMDGIDGIAACQGIVAAGAAGWIAAAHGDYSLAFLLLILAASLLGFLIHNWPPAKIFMGDVGSAFLGFVFAGLALEAGTTPEGAVPFVAWVVLLSPFLFDSGVTLVRRIARGERWYEAHREHLYQRLVRAGWSHLSVTSVYLGLDILLALPVVGYYAYGLGPPVFMAVLVPAVLAGLTALTNLVEARHTVAAKG